MWKWSWTSTLKPQRLVFVYTNTHCPQEREVSRMMHMYIHVVYVICMHVCTCTYVYVQWAHTALHRLTLCECFVHNYMTVHNYYHHVQCMCATIGTVLLLRPDSEDQFVFKSWWWKWRQTNKHHLLQEDSLCRHPRGQLPANIWPAPPLTSGTCTWLGAIVCSGSYWWLYLQCMYMYMRLHCLHLYAWIYYVSIVVHCECSSHI